MLRVVCLVLYVCIDTKVLTAPQRAAGFSSAQNDTHMNTNLPCELATANETSAPSWSQATCGVASAFVSSKPCVHKYLACCPCMKGLQCSSHLGTSYCPYSNNLGTCNAYCALAVTLQQQTLAGMVCRLPETSELMHPCCKRRAGTRDTCTECLLSLM